MVPSPEQVAAAVLARYGIHDAPVPVHDLARRGGVIVHKEYVPESETRAAVMVDLVGRAHIVVNTAECDWPAERFWIAHEIGHLALWYRRIALVPRLREIWCSRFAAALLMPEEAVLRLRVSAKWVPYREMFDVSQAVVDIRLRHLHRTGATGGVA